MSHCISIYYVGGRGELCNFLLYELLKIIPQIDGLQIQPCTTFFYAACSNHWRSWYLLPIFAKERTLCLNFYQISYSRHRHSQHSSQTCWKKFKKFSKLTFLLSFLCKILNLVQKFLGNFYMDNFTKWSTILCNGFMNFSMSIT